MKTRGFSRKRRLTEKSEFVRLFDEPLRYRAPSFQAFWKENGKVYSRLGITIKGRLTSPWRFRLKRVIREWFRNAVLFRSSPESLGRDLNIVIKVTGPLTWKYIDELRNDLNHWSKSF